MGRGRLPSGVTRARQRGARPGPGWVCGPCASTPGRSQPGPPERWSTPGPRKSTCSSPPPAGHAPRPARTRLGSWAPRRPRSGRGAASSRLPPRCSGTGPPSPAVAACSAPRRAAGKRPARSEGAGQARLILCGWVVWHPPALPRPQGDADELS